ncbi:MAG TPA: SDR family NAD(P)-dependent oxidoreductase [Gemmatimonadales bacterium]|jgi:3-oxoacyl-[acyl-carrier protein] reductase|nr:SDR family NAD(P)-dependent oxidoreductase [Gemmatimonadales bacterium]
MPLPSFGFGHRPSWEYERPDGSGAALEEPQPQPVRSGWRGKVAIVTGGATGLGRNIALEFARLGCQVAFCYVNMPGRDVTEQALLTEAAIGAMGAGVLAMRCDVRDRAAVEQFVLEVRQRLGGVHYLINNAGIANDGALWRLSEDAWQEVIDTNVTGAFNCIRAVAPTFRAQHYGKIVSVSAHQAERPGFGVANYAASKAALLGLTRAAAVELGPANVNVNAVAPGFIRTERMAMLPAEVIERAQKSAVLGRVADPDDVAHVISFLCSESARHITGQTIVVDGGLSLE